VAVVLPGKFIYLATLHTASSSITDALKTLPGAFQPKDPRAGVGRHASLDQVQHLCGSKLTGTEFVFAAVRHPYDIIVSWYLRNRTHFQIPKGATLLEFLRVWVDLDAEPFMRQHRIFFAAEGAKHVMRYERGIQTELNNVLRKIPLVPEVTLVHENATADKEHWSTYYDEETYAFVNETFASDISRYGYCFHQV
jgi:hypothetical protein